MGFGDKKTCAASGNEGTNDGNNNAGDNDDNAGNNNNNAGTDNNEDGNNDNNDMGNNNNNNEGNNNEGNEEDNNNEGTSESNNDDGSNEGNDNNDSSDGNNNAGNNDENLDDDLEKKPKGHLGGLMGAFKHILQDAVKPIQAKLESLEEKSKSMHKKENVDVSKMVEPLTSKLDAIVDQVEQTGTSSAGLKEKIGDVKASIKDGSAANQDVGSTVKGINDKVQQAQKDVAGLKK